MTAGEDTVLTCTLSLPRGVHGNTNFQWEGPGGVLQSGVADSTTSAENVITSSDLILSEISLAQAGQYTCTATLYGSNTTSINISVYGK